MDYTARLTNLKQQGQYRSLRVIDSPQTATVVLDGRERINFCSNNYLGLAADPRLAAAAARAAQEYAWGAGAAALISGHMRPHQALRDALRELYHPNEVLVFNSGYHANIGIIPALLKASGEGSEESGVFFSDELNHASIIDGCRLARGQHYIYRHRDSHHLEELLGQHTAPGPRWIITEAVFSMDGDRAPLEELAELAARYEAGLYIDEAHAVGVFGEGGRGLWEDVGARHAVPLHVRMGTLGKAFGSYGAFVVSDASTIDYLLNQARAFIFTTALPPAVAAASAKAIEIVQAEPERREKIWENVHLLSDSLGIEAPSPIIPWSIPGNAAVLQATEKLLEQGFYVQAIRAPTVPVGTERLRITVSAMHTLEQVEGLAEAIKRL